MVHRLRERSTKCPYFFDYALRVCQFARGQALCGGKQETEKRERTLIFFPAHFCPQSVNLNWTSRASRLSRARRTRELPYLKYFKVVCCCMYLPLTWNLNNRTCSQASTEQARFFTAIHRSRARNAAGAISQARERWEAAIYTGCAVSSYLQLLGQTLSLYSLQQCSTDFGSSDIHIQRFTR